MLNLENKEWKDFSISEIFNKIYIAKSQDFGKMKKGKIPFIGRAAINNGFQGMVDSKIEEEGNCISIGMVSTTFKAFYRDVKFACSQNILILRMDQLTRNKALFLNSVFNSTILLIFSYGKPIKLANFKKQKILLPVNEKNEPDYEYMENHTKLIIDKKVEIYKKYIQKVLDGLEYKEIEPLENKEWKEFSLNELFSISGTITTHPSKLIKGGSVPRITCSSTTNGLDDLYSNEATEEGGVLTVDSAAIGYVAYQEKDFIATDHVEKIFMKDKKINRNLGLGLVTCIRNSTLNKFNYGYKFSQERIKKQKILLPINEKNEPDYEYMEQYSKNLMYKKIKQYLNYKNKEA